MARIIYVCLRNQDGMPDFATRLKILDERLSPDNIQPNPPVLLEGKGIWVGILNPTAPLLTSRTSVCTGAPIFIPGNWANPGGGDPDGTYALFRSDEDFVELGADIAASRTIWYAHTDTVFIASNSQRAIVAFLEDFQPNPSASTWMLATGVLGPNCAWDARIHYVEADSHVLLDRKSWKLSLRTREGEYHPDDAPAGEHKANLRRAIEEVFGEINLDPSHWALALSGGLDSRGILVFLKDHLRPGAVSWGVKVSLDNPMSDTRIAESVADYFHIPHSTFQLDQESVESGETVLNRFVALGEGRMDYLHGYMEGFSIRKTLFEKGIWGIIRGDELMGRPRMYTEHQALARNNVHLFSEFSNLPDRRAFDLPEQVLPDQYQRREGEELCAYEYRIHRCLRMPTAVASWCEIKTGYGEVMNPLLSRKVDQVYQTIPAALTQDKKLFREIVLERTPGLPMAKVISIASIEDIFRKPRFLEPVMAELSSDEARAELSPALIDFITANISVDEKEVSHSFANTLKKEIKTRFPQLLAISSRIPRKDTMDINKLAFRAFIISKTRRMLREDARLFKRLPAAGR